MTVFELYLISRADDFIKLFKFLSVICVFSLFIWALIHVLIPADDEILIKLKGHFDSKLKYFIVATCIFFIGALFVPSKKDIFMIYAGPKILKTENIESIEKATGSLFTVIEKAGKLLENKVDKMLDEK